MANEKYLFHLKNLAFEVIIPWFTPDCNVFRGRWGAVCFWELLCYDKEKGGVDMDGIFVRSKTNILDCSIDDIEFVLPQTNTLTILLMKSMMKQTNCLQSGYRQ